MQLTQFTDIGLRVLMYLTYQDRDEAVRISELAQQFGVPRNHLTKVVNRLGHLGWIDATRGRNGGVRLAPGSERLRIGRIIRELEQCTQLIDCGGLECVLNHGCRLKLALAAGLESFYATMDEYTLADVVAAPTGNQIARMHRTYLGTP